MGTRAWPSPYARKAISCDRLPRAHRRQAGFLRTFCEAAQRGGAKHACSDRMEQTMSKIASVLLGAGTVIFAVSLVAGAAAQSQAPDLSGGAGGWVHPRGT